MGAVNADPVIYTLVFGESVLNDAVAIVLVRILQTMGRVGFQDPFAYIVGVGQFFGVSLGSLLVALLVSGMSAFLLRRFDMSHHPAFELAMILLVGYASCNTYLAGSPCSQPTGSHSPAHSPVLIRMHSYLSICFHARCSFLQQIPPRRPQVAPAFWPSLAPACSPVIITLIPYRLRRGRCAMALQ